MCFISLIGRILIKFKYDERLVIVVVVVVVVVVRVSPNLGCYILLF
jgi:hypothetical protein